MDSKKINAMFSVLWVVSLMLNYLSLDYVVEPQTFPQELEAVFPGHNNDPMAHAC